GDGGAECLARGSRSSTGGGSGWRGGGGARPAGRRGGTGSAVGHRRGRRDRGGAGVRGLVVPQHPVARPPGRESAVSPVLRYTLLRFGLLLLVFLVLLPIPALSVLGKAMLGLVITMPPAWVLPGRGRGGAAAA